MSSQNRIGLILVLGVLLSAGLMVFSRDSRAAADEAIGNVSVACGPNQRALVERVEATSQVTVACVDAGNGLMMAATPHGASGLMPAGYYPQPAMAPVAAYAPTPVVPAVAPVAIATPAPALPATRSTQAAPVRRATSSKPSTEKRLLVIGGTAGAGAGIGALIGGRKGALIGAAVGAGGATLVDQIKHR